VVRLSKSTPFWPAGKRALGQVRRNRKDEAEFASQEGWMDSTSRTGRWQTNGCVLYLKASHERVQDVKEVVVVDMMVVFVAGADAGAGTGPTGLQRGVFLNLAVCSVGQWSP
jgi:hypothetical protein